MATWNVYAMSYDDNADLANGVHSIRTKFNDNVIVSYIRTWVLTYGSPVFTSLHMEVYSDVNGSKGGLIATSTNSFSNTDITSKAFSAKEIYFTFDKDTFDSNNWYHLVLKGTPTAFTSSSHIAWKSSYPYPIYTTGITASVNLREYPYTMCTIGASL
jgi:hypothetical protein